MEVSWGGREKIHCTHELSVDLSVCSATNKKLPELTMNTTIQIPPPAETNETKNPLRLKPASYLNMLNTLCNTIQPVINLEKYCRASETRAAASSANSGRSGQMQRSEEPSGVEARRGGGGEAARFELERHYLLPFVVCGARRRRKPQRGGGFLFRDRYPGRRFACPGLLSCRPFGTSASLAGARPR